MRSLGVILRWALTGLLVLLAGLSATASIGVYSRLEDGRVYMKMNAMRFQSVGGFVMEYRAVHRTYPSDKQLRNWAKKNGYDNSWVSNLGGNPVNGSSVACSNAQPEPGFQLPDSDVFVLHRWRGEWFDCYSLPSRTTNVVHSLAGDWPFYHVLWWSLSMGCLAGAWFAKPKPT